MATQRKLEQYCKELNQFACRHYGKYWHTTHHFLDVKRQFDEQRASQGNKSFIFLTYGMYKEYQQ